MEKVDLLGVGINDVSLDQAVEVVGTWLSEKSGKHYIVTPNPEFLMAADKDAEFKKILNEADLAIPDGAGLKLSRKIKNTTTGTDLMDELCKKGAKKGWKIGLLGGRNGAVLECAKNLEKKYPGLKIVFAEEGGGVDEDGKMTTDYRLPTTAEDGRPKTVDILFVAFGQVKQEKWIANNLEKLPVKVAMGVGGAFDYFAGVVPRAPSWMRKIGLEWLFRLILQPWRVRRQIKLLEFVYQLLVKSQ